jgi:flagellar basal-body rod modification protein FlgD
MVWVRWTSGFEGEKMNVNAVSGAAGAPTQNPNAGSAALISSDFQTFLRMMTTQLQNQDPLNPIDSADYAVQLATFSGVEQQARTNALLESMAAQMGLSTLAQLAPWVGREARSAAAVQVGSDPISLSFKAAPGADRAVLAVYDTQNRLVSRQDVNVADTATEWTPSSIGGGPLPPGKYTLKLESYALEQRIAETPVEHYARISEIRNGPAGATIVLEGGIEISAAQVTALRD